MNLNDFRRKKRSRRASKRRTLRFERLQRRELMAGDFTGADFWGWCREAGFRRYEVMHLAGPCSAAIAYK